jgi:hypothetical protein
MDTSAQAPAPIRPFQVTLAIALLGIALFLAPVRSVLRSNWDSPLSAAVSVLVLIGIVMLWLYGLHRRKRWVWWLTIVLLLPGAIGIPWDAARQGVGFERSLYYAQCAATIPALLLFCLPPARRWFRVTAA